MNRYAIGVGLWVVGGCALAYVCGRIIRDAPSMCGIGESHPSRKAQAPASTPAQVAGRAEPSSESVVRLYDWERVEREHRFLHVSLRNRATLRVSMCSCGWESRPFMDADLAVEDWQVHAAFERMVGEMTR